MNQTLRHTHAGTKFDRVPERGVDDGRLVSMLGRAGMHQRATGRPMMGSLLIDAMVSSVM
jgi:hypothetical protein